MSTTTFAAVSAVKQHSDTGFSVDLSPAWTIGGRPNGGYLLATIARAATVVSGHPDVLAASAHYLRSPEPGPAEIEVEVLRTGRTATQLRGRLLKDGVPQVEALLTLGVLGEAEPFWQDGVPRPEFGPFPEEPWGPAVLTSGIPIAIRDEIDVYFDRPLADGPSGRGELRALLALPGDEPFDPVSLLFAVDALPCGDPRRRAVRLGPDARTDRLRAGASGSRPGARAAPRPPDRRRAGRRVLPRVGQRRDAGRAGHAAGRDPDRLSS